MNKWDSPAMTRASYTDELMAALARQDAADLQQAMKTYHEYYHSQGKAKDAIWYANKDDIEKCSFTCDAPERGIALVVLAASTYDEADFLFFVSAGTLENLLLRPSHEIIDRVVAEARKNPRFRWMLTGIYLHAISDNARARIMEAIGSMTESDPMPPRSI